MMSKEGETSFSLDRSITTSASCSMDPDSRRSDNAGLRFCASRLRFNWLNATTGKSSSSACAFMLREIALTSS